MKCEIQNSFKRILTYLMITILLAAYSYYEIIARGTLLGNDRLVMVLMWSPAVSAIITKVVFDRNLIGLGIKRSRFRYLAAAYLIPLGAGLAVYSFVWLTGLGGFRGQQVTQLAGMATLGVLLSCTSAAGEEIGWRGFLLSELLKSNSFIKASLFSALIWYIYHCPLILFAGYNNGISVASSMVFFGITIISFTIIVNHITVKSGSVWPAVLIHASHNLFIQAIFDPMTVDRGLSKYITSEFGVGLAVMYSIVAIYILRKNYCKGKLTFDSEGLIEEGGVVKS